MFAFTFFPNIRKKCEYEAIVKLTDAKCDIVLLSQYYCAPFWEFVGCNRNNAHNGLCLSAGVGPLIWRLSCFCHGLHRAKHVSCENHDFCE
jgi:hypothetical protein